MANATMSADPYWSRMGDQWEAAERIDPVVWGDSYGPLSMEQLSDYEQRGFHTDRQLIPHSEADELLSEARSLASGARSMGADVIAEPGSDIVRSVFRVHRISERFKAVCKDPRVVDVVRQMLGSDVYVQQSRINFKPAMSGKEFFWHSDFETWHVEDGMPRMRAVSVSINLSENHEFNGPLMVVPGSHHYFIRCVGATPEDHFKDSLRKQEYGVPSREALEMLVERGGMEAPKGRPGSALFFECNLMHASTGNLSPHPRTNLFVVYNSVENPVDEPYGDRPPRPEFLAEREVIPVDEL